MVCCNVHLLLVIKNIENKIRLGVLDENIVASELKAVLQEIKNMLWNFKVLHFFKRQNMTGCYSFISIQMNNGLLHILNTLSCVVDKVNIDR